ncbi:TWF1 [Candida pseudojiufengensis]|uniref:TWF1 n=1 Tax=Candida pseudojiufengensis TaxID=497109 RepID=UPI0022254408|nr:TWF1 [Candida pseudojiufengensis]KAI5966165.1 TWF1 [Candida pseudojiufengensis]
MSTQSGITTSKELLSDFKNEKNDKIIVIKISQDSTQLIPDNSFTSESSSISSLNTFLSKEYPQPSYIIIPQDSYEIFISFIPDSAPIKQKMLYASTKNTLITELGSNNFQYKFSFTELDEITEPYINKCVKDEQNSNSHKLEAQTNDENLINNLNNQSNYGYKRELVSMSQNKDNNNDNILYKFDDELIKEFKNLAESSNNDLIIFNIDIKNEIIKLLKKSSGVKLNNLISEFNNLENGPKYALYNYSPKGSYAFIYTCPSGSSVKDRMIYAASKNSLISLLKSQYFKSTTKIDKNLEVGDLDELELSELEEDKKESSNEITPSSSSSSTSTNTTNNGGLKFNKPKGPRRR